MVRRIRRLKSGRRKASSMAWNNRGLAYFQKKSYSKALSDFNKAIQLNPQYANAYNNRGLTYFNRKDYDKAIADFNKAVQLNPDLAVAYNNRAHAYFQKKSYTKALEDVQRAQQLKFPVHKELTDNLKKPSGKKK